MMGEYLVDMKGENLSWFWKSIAAMAIVMSCTFAGGFLLGWFLCGRWGI